MVREPLKAVLSFGDFTLITGDSLTDFPLQIRARALTGFDTVVRLQGGLPETLLQKVGINPEVLQNPEATVPLQPLLEVLELAAEQLALPDFGLRMAACQDITVLGAIALIVRYSANIGEALHGIALHLPYHISGARLQLVDDARVGLIQLHYGFSLDAEMSTRQAVELSYSVLYRFMRLLSGGDCSNWELHFGHAQGLSAKAYRRYFDCPVLLGQRQDFLVLPRTLLSVPINPNHADLRAVAERYISNVIRRFPLDIGRQVQVLAERQLGTSACTIVGIAAQLGLHKRTLQRRLAQQGLYFEEILDGLRRQRAEQYLPHAAIPLAQVAALLGYSEQSAFNRACQRWFGCSPGSMRQRAQR